MSTGQQPLGPQKVLTMDEMRKLAREAGRGSVIEIVFIPISGDDLRKKIDGVLKSKGLTFSTAEAGNLDNVAINYRWEFTSYIARIANVDAFIKDVIDQGMLESIRIVQKRKE